MLTQLAALAMKHSTRHAVPTLAPIELRQGASTLGFVIDVSQRVQRLVDSAELRNGQCQPGWPITNLECSHDAGGGYAAELERTRQAEHVVPTRRDFFQAKVVSRNRVEETVVSLRVNSPKAGATHVRQS